MENAVKGFEPSIDHFIRIIGSGIEIFGVLVIVIGIGVYATSVARRVVLTLFSTFLSD